VIVLDTNVLSEILRPQPHPHVASWVKFQRRTELFTTAICEAELLYGIALMPEGARRRALESAVRNILHHEIGDRVLPFDGAAAREYAGIASERQRSGRPISEFDAQIAAIARSRGAAVATRNIADFAECETEVIDPWNADPRR
jgi:toxin FitB